MIKVNRHALAEQEGTQQREAAGSDAQDGASGASRGKTDLAGHPGTTGSRQSRTNQPPVGTQPRGDSMTQRESPRPAAESTTTGSLPGHFTAPLSSLLFSASSAGSFWEEWYSQATDSQRRQVLELAREQCLAAHQLPPRESAPPPGRSFLADLLAGDRRDLPPFQPDALAPLDSELDDTQRLAVARALATPDLALVRGYPGTGKSRVVAELLRQADRAGRRTLFLAASPAALDRALEHVGSDGTCRIVRCLAADERLEALPRCVARLTLPGRLRHFEEQTLPAARRAVEQARAAWEARCREEPTWSRLECLLDRLQGLKAHLDELEAQRPGLPGQVENELEQGEPTSPLRSAWLDCQRRAAEKVAQVETCLAGVRSEIDRLVGEQQQCDSEMGQLLPLIEARQGGKWWTGSWWRAVFRGDAQPRLEQLRAQGQQIAERLQSLRRESDELAGRRRQAEHDRDEQRRALIERETTRRQADLEARHAELARQRDELKAAWQAACEALSPGTQRPGETSPSALAEARAAWRAQLDRDEQEARLRHDWLEALQHTLPGLAAHLARSARIVAATTACLSSQQKSAGDDPAGDFDLLVIDEAHRLSEAELHAAARLARRWVLVGEAPVELPAPAGQRSAGKGPARPRAVLPRPVFERLWDHLHADPRRLPARWRLVDDALVCALRPVEADQERWLQREPVFDRPEIELGILSPPDLGPQVAEVRFPASMPLEEARAYLFREMDELAVQPAGANVHWRQDDGSITLLFGSPAGQRRQVDLGGGVREHLVCCAGGGADEVGWKTAALEFERALGWDADRARTWVEERLGLRDLGRTTVLARPYRAQGELACFLSGLLYAGAFNGDREPGPASVEFVAVPSPADAPGRAETQQRRHTAQPGGGGTATLVPRTARSSFAAAGRGGAGLEIDLADVPRTEQRGAARRTDLLPGDLRPHLPARGVVNYLEAQAIVSALELLVSDPAFQSASAAWQQRRAAACGAAAGACAPQSVPSVAVFSLFPAQVELLRALVRRSARLAESGIPIEVGLPDSLAQRECLAALVGLTRSHTHRAVPFSDTPERLVQALTRPVSRLMLFGDPGTLLRRSQWHGALDHLDEAAGTLEQGLIAQLLGGLAETETQRDRARGGNEERAGRPRESSSV